MSSLLNAIPAATRVPDYIERRVLDTSQFVGSMRCRGFRLVYGTQVTPHIDAQMPAGDAQHLVILERIGYPTALALLNSHDKNRRARLGMGLWHDNHLLLLYKRPIQRWKPWAPVAEALLDVEDTVIDILEVLNNWRPTSDTALELIEHVIHEGYKKRSHRPQAQATLDRCDTLNMSRLALGIMKAMQSGNITPVRGARNIKGLSTPETIFNAAYTVGHTTALFAQLKGKLSRRFEFG